MQLKLTQISAIGLLALLSLGQGGSNISAWEKPIAPGVTYRFELEKDPHRLVHIIRWVASNPVVSVRPELAGLTVYEPGETKGRSTVGELQRQTNAIAVVNADFFPYTGDPLGLMVRNGSLLSTPNPKRAVFAWGNNGSQTGIAKFLGTVTPEGGSAIAIDGFNEECPLNKVTLNTPAVGLSLSKAPSLTVFLKVDGGLVPPSTEVQATVRASSNDAGNTPVQADQFTLVAQGDKIPLLASLKPGQRVKIKLQTSGFDWEKIEHAVSGGPFLLKDGKVWIDAEEEGFNFDFSGKRHPRTAMGRTAEGDLLLVVVDGRQTMSVGATLAEMADIMLRNGCRDAINLDGGGSSAINVLGVTLNRPSDKTGERPISNGVALFGPRLTSDGQQYKIRAPKSARIGQTTQLEVIDSRDRVVPNIEVLWSMMGAGWMDQGGMASFGEAGEAKVRAFVRGQIVTLTIPVYPGNPN